MLELRVLDHEVGGRGLQVADVIAGDHATGVDPHAAQHGFVRLDAFRDPREGQAEGLGTGYCTFRLTGLSRSPGRAPDRRRERPLCDAYSMREARSRRW